MSDIVFDAGSAEISKFSWSQVDNYVCLYCNYKMRRVGINTILYIRKSKYTQVRWLSRWLFLWHSQRLSNHTLGCLEVINFEKVNWTCGPLIAVVSVLLLANRTVTEANLRSHWSPRTCPVFFADLGFFTERVSCVLNLSLSYNCLAPFVCNCDYLFRFQFFLIILSFFLYL